MNYNIKAMNKKNQKAKEYKDNKGNWEYSFFQKRHDPNAEATIKLSMKPDNGFNPKNVHEYISPSISKEEIILKKKENGENLKTNEQIIYQNIIDRRQKTLLADIEAIKSQGLSAKPETKEGKTRMLLHTLDYQLKKGNKELVANIYLRLMEDQFEITPEIRNDYASQIRKCDDIVSKLDLIELQFTKFHSQMPPLNVKGFRKFDEWQIQVINNIDNNISTIVNAPTSAGKSVLSGYATTKGKTLFVVPTDALAWQMSAYIGHILNTCVPILTATYQSNPKRDELIELLNKASAIVGTADTIVDYLPFIKNDFKWLIFDEVHMIGKPEGSAMEHIIKILNNIPIIALSATIGNTDEIVSWFSKISQQMKFNKVICDKRFFNLQRYYYNQDTDKLVCLHPLALIEESQIADGSILKKSLQPTPPNTWDLAIKISKLNNKLDPHKYFSINKRIELDESNKYFSLLIEFLVEKYKTDKIAVMNIVNSYKQQDLLNCSTDLLKLAFRLKSEDKNPVIIFQNNTVTCLKMAKEFAKNVDQAEIKKYPKLLQERMKQQKLARRFEKNEPKVDNDKSSKKETKELMGGVKKDGYETVVDKQTIEVTALQEPHADFNFNNNQYFSEGKVEDWVNEFKKYFPNTGDYYHFVIKLLWRGVGIYARNLPEPYLRLVQSLACQKQLAIVFSDLSLVFGVSMPFRSVVIIRNENQDDDLDSMLFQQMSGRAGRRGLDKEGNVIFAGYSWDRIKELSISEPPIIIGTNNPIYTIPHANQLSRLHETNQDWKLTTLNLLDKSVDHNDIMEFTEGLSSNYMNSWNFSYQEQNINHLHMNWKFRYTDEGVLVSYLIPFLRRGFESKDYALEVNQVSIAHFLCRFLCTKETTENILEDPAILSENPFNQIMDQLRNLQIDTVQFVDNKLFLAIQHNTILCNDDVDEIRQRLLDFGDKVKNIQHYCFHSKITGLAKIMGKLLTRIWWIYHISSPIVKSYIEYEEKYEEK
jgi:superfamily II DNA or RNA helicase